MRCDLHVHTIHSGMCTVPLLRRICRESYSAPLEVYATLKRRGMDLVTITDHDSIDAAEALRRHPDFFLSQEVSCRTPSGTNFHMGVYDISDRQHVELQRRRDDFFSLIGYLTEQQLFFSVNHVFSGLTGSRSASDFALFEEYFPAVETRNGQTTSRSNRCAADYARHLGKAEIAGSDAHTLASLGSTCIEVPGARNREEFLCGLRRAAGVAHGESGDYAKLTRAVLEIGGGMMAERAWTRVLAPAVPLITLGFWLREIAFAYYWERRARRMRFPNVMFAGEVLRSRQ